MFKATQMSAEHLKKRSRTEDERKKRKERKVIYFKDVAIQQIVKDIGT